MFSTDRIKAKIRCWIVHLCYRPYATWDFWRVWLGFLSLQTLDEFAVNHRAVWAGRDPKDHQVPTPLSWTGMPLLDQVAPPIQPGLERLQGASIQKGRLHLYHKEMPNARSSLLYHWGIAELSETVYLGKKKKKRIGSILLDRKSVV